MLSINYFKQPKWTRNDLAIGQKDFLKKLILLFSKDTLNLSNVTVKTVKTFQINAVLLNPFFNQKIKSYKYQFPQKYDTDNNKKYFLSSK